MQDPGHLVRRGKRKKAILGSDTHSFGDVRNLAQLPALNA